MNIERIYVSDCLQQVVKELNNKEVLSSYIIERNMHGFLFLYLQRKDKRELREFTTNALFNQLKIIITNCLKKYNLEINVVWWENEKRIRTLEYNPGDIQLAFQLKQLN